MNKILIIRFSSIGDIILTTPVIRCIREQRPELEIHFVTKKNFLPVLQHNPHLYKVHSFENDIDECIPDLKKEKFDFVIDLHRNLRSTRLKKALAVPSSSFDKINLRKFLSVYFKMRSALPPVHIVNRYLDAALPLGVKDDGKGLEYYLNDGDEINVGTRYFSSDHPLKFLALVIGGSYYTKKIPFNKLSEIIEKAHLPILLLGGPGDLEESKKLQERFTHLKSSVGELSINQSASVIQQAEWVLTADTGLMHVAAAFHKKTISVWGNTIPEFGMSVYKPQPENMLKEIKDLACRPCSKLGYGKCPLGHFKCMQQIDYDFVKDLR